MNRASLTLFRMAVGIALFGILHGVCLEAVGAEPRRRATPRSETERTTLELKVDGEESKSVEIALGESARDVFARLKPASAATDDDPWLLYAAARGGHYALFFRAEADVRNLRELLDPNRGKLYAVVHYPTEGQKDGKVLLPEAMRRTTVGEFTTLKVQVSAARVAVATVALGMSAEQVLELYRPATDRAEGEHAIALNSVDKGGQYLLLFSTQERAPESKPGVLAEIVYQPGEEAVCSYLLPRSKVGEPVPPAYQAMLKASVAATHAVD